MESVVLVNKPRGVTPLQAITFFLDKFPEYKNEKVSFAGRLDPMANGLLLLLVGDENKKRKDYESLSKTYEFELLLGVSTDSYDLLGKITGIKASQTITPQFFSSISSTFLGTYLQDFPPYSSKTVQGKPLFYWARQGLIDQITLPKKERTIFKLDLKKTTPISSRALSETAILQIEKVQGEFRQETIGKDWLSLGKETEIEFLIFHCTAIVSSGTYIRSLCYEIGKKMGYPALAYSITRTHIGKYSLTEALSLTGGN